MLLRFDNFPNHWEISRYFTQIFPKNSKLVNFFLEKHKIQLSKNQYVKVCDWVFQVMKINITMTWIIMLFERTTSLKQRNNYFIWTLIHVNFFHNNFYGFYQWYWVTEAILFEIVFVETCSERQKNVNKEVIVYDDLFQIWIHFVSPLFDFQDFWDLLETCFWPLTWNWVLR